MSALDELRNKDFINRTKIEKALLQLWEDTDGYEWMAVEAAAELAAMQERIKTLEEALKPFAEEPILPEFDDDLYKDTQILVGDFRRAARALKGDQ